MSPFRPNNINKRSYPGNGGIVGITTLPHCTTSSSVICQCHPSCGACQCNPMSLGCCSSCCGCPCCQRYCCCTQTDYTAVVPGGMYKLSEQKTAIDDNSWTSSSTTGSPVLIDCRNNGVADVSNLSDCCGWYFCCSGTQKYFATGGYPKTGFAFGGGSCWVNQDNEVTRAVSCYGFSGQWHNPSQPEALGSFDCRTYWTGQMLGMWTCESASATSGCNINWCTGCVSSSSKTYTYRRARAFRCA